MHSFIDFPKDDAGVIISDILKLYKGTSNEQELLEISEKKFKQKIELLDNLKKEKVFFENTYDMFITDKLTISKEKLFSNKLFTNLNKKYMDTFFIMYIKPYE